MKDYKIIDNFLPKKLFKDIQKHVTYSLPYYYINNVSDINNSKDGYHFNHYFFGNNKVQSQDFNKIIEPILSKIKYFSLIRAKANCYPSTSKIEVHGKHKDFPFPYKGLLFYINTNNGFTILNDGTKIASVENRALFFDTSKEHQSTTCTDKFVRLNININYV